MGNCALPRPSVRFSATGLACAIFINIMYASRRQLTAGISLGCGTSAKKPCLIVLRNGTCLAIH